MRDLIELKLATKEEAESLHRLQVEAFMPLYEKYRDDDTSPAKESIERVTEKITEENSDFYFILFHEEKVGGVRVRWHQGKKYMKILIGYLLFHNSQISKERNCEQGDRTIIGYLSKHNRMAIRYDKTGNAQLSFV